MTRARLTAWAAAKCYGSSWQAMTCQSEAHRYADAIGAGPEKGVLGTQLGPNRNGKKW